MGASTRGVPPIWAARSGDKETICFCFRAILPMKSLKKIKVKSSKLWVLNKAWRSLQTLNAKLRRKKSQMMTLGRTRCAFYRKTRQPRIAAWSRGQSRLDVCQRTQTQGSHSIKSTSPNKKSSVFCNAQKPRLYSKWQLRLHFESSLCS